MIEQELEPYFERRGDAVVGRPHASSPWSEAMVGGRALSGLVAWGAERDHGEDGWQPARFTVDMFRPAPIAPLVVTSRRLRDGAQVRACDVFVHHEEKLISRGTALFIRRGSEPPGRVWAPPGWDGPMPDALPEEPRLDARFSLGEVRQVTPMDAPTKRLAWLREDRDLVDGINSSPFVRLAGMADYTHPFTNLSDVGLGYINADLTMYLSRMPRGEWVGFESIAHTSADGITVGGVAMHDREGAIGYTYVCGVVDGRMQSRSGG
jgi:hypothetical protein